MIIQDVLKEFDILSLNEVTLKFADYYLSSDKSFSYYKIPENACVHLDLYKNSYPITISTPEETYSHVVYASPLERITHLNEFLKKQFNTDHDFDFSYNQNGTDILDPNSKLEKDKLLYLFGNQTRMVCEGSLGNTEILISEITSISAAIGYLKIKYEMDDISIFIKDETKNSYETVDILNQCTKKLMDFECQLFVHKTIPNIDFLDYQIPLKYNHISELNTIQWLKENHLSKIMLIKPEKITLRGEEKEIDNSKTLVDAINENGGRFKIYIPPPNNTFLSFHFIKKKTKIMTKKSDYENIVNDIKEDIKELYKYDNCYIGIDSEKNFKTIEKIGQGKKSIAFKTFDTTKSIFLCKKILKVEDVEFKDIANAIKEFEIVKALDHPCIIKTIGINLTEKYNFKEDGITTISIFLEYLDFRLLDCLKMGIIKNTLKTRILVEVAHGMRFIHENNLIYRVLKIDSIMLNSVFQAKIIDFSLAYSGDETDTFSKTKKVGIETFMSPEMIQGDDYDNKTDVFSFGILIYFMFVGKMPNQSSEERETGQTIEIDESETISKCCIDLINKCLIKEPERRPSFDDILLYLRENKYMLAIDVDSSIVSQRDNELELINK
ncbi:hypothetical protein M9Y10_020504 [Tritrichomonas musculus]|uniref:Protein kinase domain-containing protein n=1 Tax=Tritrichomonas musculus TaxID=1915356 RepID=A0ABR2HGE9_9EUKA